MNKSALNHTETMPQLNNSLYNYQYDKSLLFAVPRLHSRTHLNIPNQITFPAVAKYMIESKSLQLYLHWFSETIFSSKEGVAALLETALSELIKVPFAIQLLLKESKSD